MYRISMTVPNVQWNRSRHSSSKCLLSSLPLPGYTGSPLLVGWLPFVLLLGTLIQAVGAMHDMEGVNPDNQLMDANGNPNALAKAYFDL